MGDSEQQASDRLLIKAIQKDDYISYNKLFVLYYGRLCQYAYSFLMNKEDAEDIVQELFLNLWNNRKKTEISANVSAYLYKTAKNLTLNHLRAAKKHQSLQNYAEEMLYYEENRLEADEFRIALFDCINRLPARSKEVFLYHRMQGLKQKEIAEKLNISVKTIKNQVWSSLQKLKHCLELKEF